MKYLAKRNWRTMIGGFSLALVSSIFSPHLIAFQQTLPDQANVPEGRLKQSLSRLPPSVQQKVLERLRQLNTPAIDMLLMEADESGELYYVEEGLTDSSPSSVDSAVTLPPIDVFDLHSNPSATNTLFLDFDGGTIAGKAWGGGQTYNAVAYDLDGDPTSFNSTERSRIHEIWTRIADDFAPFNINVTTKTPNSFGPNTGWLLFTKDTDINGVAMPSQGAGGVAYVGVWGRSNYSYYQPALVYYNRLGSGTSSYMAEAGSHEIGHNLSLGHDGTSSESYFRGLGSDSEPSSWAPIMGVGYYKNVTQWSRGEYPDANQFQDDIAIITNHLGASNDNDGNNQSPIALAIDANGQFNATNRQDDPYNIRPENKGIVQVADSDWFQFDAGSGPAEFHVRPAWDSFYRTTRRGANLDIGFRLYNSAGDLIASSSDSTETSASLTIELISGIHTIEVFGTSGPYASDYGSQGYYYLNGSVTISSPDTIPPDPNPMRFVDLPTAVDANTITMQAETAVDDRGGVVNYLFKCEQNGISCGTGNWQNSTVFNAGSLQADTQYCFAVQARDTSGNTTELSAMACATTPALPPIAEPPLAPSNLTVIDGQDGSANIEWQDNSNNEINFEIQREFLHKSGRWQGNAVIATLTADTTSYSDSSGTGTYRYRVRSVNTSASSDWTPWKDVTVTNSGNDGGGDKPCRGKKCSG